MLIPHPVLINSQEQKSEDRVNIPPCLNHSEEQKSADLINPEEHRNQKIMLIPHPVLINPEEQKSADLINPEEPNSIMLKHYPVN